MLCCNVISPKENASPPADDYNVIYLLQRRKALNAVAVTACLELRAAVVHAAAGGDDSADAAVAAVAADAADAADAGVAPAAAALAVDPAACAAVVRGAAVAAAAGHAGCVDALAAACVAAGY